MPSSLSVRRRSVACRESVGSTCPSHIGVISRGTPGIATMRLPFLRTSQPGAVPSGFGSARAEGMSQACFVLRSGMVRPRPANHARRSASSTASTAGVSPSAAAIASRVRSSSVGPRPPVATTSSLRASARSNASLQRPRLSPTVCMCRQSIPRSARRPAR